MTEHASSNGPLYPLRHPQAELFAEGSFANGGAVQIVDPSLELNLTLHLSSVPFTLLALLALRAQEGLEAGQPASWAFADRTQLYFRLKSLGGARHPQVVTKSIYRLRCRLHKAASAALGSTARVWSRSIIETSELGYRLSAPASQIKLILLDADLLQPVRTPLSTVP